MGTESRFADRNIVITGGSGGMGLAGARRIVVEGGRVLLTGTDEAKLARALAELGDAARAVAIDSAAEDAGERLAGAARELGPVHGLWLNAGYAAIGPLEAVDAPFFDAMMNANVRGPVLQLAALSPLLVDGASVVVTASSSAYEGGAQASVYAATKAALIALVRCWASALGGRGIRVNSLVPGPIETGFRDFMAADIRASFESEVAGQTALGRPGSADEAAAVALFLLSGDSNYVSGSQVAADGGLILR